MTPPPPFGTFPKFHPFWRRSLSLTCNIIDKVYGSNLAEQRSLRTFRGGRLRAEQGPDGTLLPSDNRDDSCTGACFKAGDSRVNINKQIF